MDEEPPKLMAAPRSTTATVLALGTAQTVAWASSYYLPAVLATPMAREIALLRQKAAGAVSQGLLLGGRVLHLGFSGHRPSANLAMMLRCTSLEPP